MLAGISVCFLAALVRVAIAVDPAGPSGDTCGLKNYDISTLHAGRPYWFFDIKDSKKCVEESAKSCSMFFTFCQALPAKYCGNTNSGMCETVTPDGSDTEKHYSLGRVTTMFDVGNEKDGFLAIFGNGSNTTDKCNRSVTVTLSLECDPKAMWDFKTGDVTEHVVLETSDPFNDCQMFFNIKYSGACIKERPEIEGCNALKHYDLNTMRSSDIWKATVPEASCKNPFTPSIARVMDDDTCELLFSFCEPLESDICANSIFCQQDTFGKGISFGSYNTEFQIDSDIDYTGFTISAYDGTKNRNCTDGFFSTLRFNCSTAANWSLVPNNDITKYVTAYPSVDECEFVIDLQYDGACTSYRPPKTKSNKTKTSPFGGILIGIFFGVLILYFAIGAVIQLIRGRRGAEIIPNHAMWTTFFMLVLEGCSFSLDIVTCYRCQSGARAKRSYDYEKL